MLKNGKPVLLVVDDVPVNIHTLAGALGDDYSIKFAKDGTSALDILSRIEKPDLILLDIMMEGMDGYEVCRRIKASESIMDIPIIFLTAKSDAEDEAYGLSIGAADYIQKPFNLPIVRARIKTQLKIKFQRDTLLRQKRELEEALEQIKILRGYLPICSSCKKIRDDQGYWSQIEEYISSHSEAEFTHSICPDCIKKLYPNLKLPKNEA